MGRKRNPNRPDPTPTWPELLHAALPYLEAVANEEQLSYGSFLGGDPRTFTPDEELCSPEEVAAWKELQAAWDRGEQPKTNAGCHGGSMGDGRYLFITMGPLGTNRFHDPDAVAIVQGIRQKLKMKPWEPPKRELPSFGLPDEITLDTDLTKLVQRREDDYDRS